jgi:hypothetical protein
MADQQHLSERLLGAAIQKSVSEKLGSLGHDISELTKGMTPADAKAAKLMILEMVRTACGDFYLKMKARIEKDKSE